MSSIGGFDEIENFFESLEVPKPQQKQTPLQELSPSCSVGFTQSPPASLQPSDPLSPPQQMPATSQPTTSCISAEPPLMDFFGEPNPAPPSPVAEAIPPDTTHHPFRSPPGVSHGSHSQETIRNQPFSTGSSFSSSESLTQPDSSPVPSVAQQPAEMSALAADTGAGQTSRPVSKDPKQELELLQRRLLEQQRILDMHRQRGNAARGGSAQVPTGAMQGMLPGGPGAAGSFSSCSPSSSPSPPVNTTQSDSPSTAAASLEPKRPVVSSMTVNPSAGHNHISSSDATPSPIPHQNSAQASPISAGTHELSVPTQAASRYSQQPDRQSRSITGPSSPVSPAAATAKKLTGFEQLASLTQGHHELTCNFTAFRTAFDGKFAMLEAMLQQVLKNQQVIHQQGSCILRLQQEVRVLQAQQQNSQQKCQGEYYPNGQGEEDVHQQGAHLPIATSQATASIAHSAKSGRNALSELLDVSQRNQLSPLSQHSSDLPMHHESGDVFPDEKSAMPSEHAQDTFTHHPGSIPQLDAPDVSAHPQKQPKKAVIFNMDRNQYKSYYETVQAEESGRDLTQEEIDRMMAEELQRKFADEAKGVEEGHGIRHGRKRKNRPAAQVTSDEMYAMQLQSEYDQTGQLVPEQLGTGQLGSTPGSLLVEQPYLQQPAMNSAARSSSAPASSSGSSTKRGSGWMKNLFGVPGSAPS